MVTAAGLSAKLKDFDFKDLLKVEEQKPQPTQKRFNIADYE